MTNETQDQAENQTPEQTPEQSPHRTPEQKTARPSWGRRYAGPVLLGIGLGLALLYLIGRLGAPREQQPEAKDDSKLMALDPRLVMTVPELPEDVEGSTEGAGTSSDPGMSVDLADLPPCEGGTEDADCLLSTVPKAWQLLVGGEPLADGGPAVVTARVGEKLGWPVVSARRGLLVSFLVEENGSVLLIYPTPEGDLPIVEAGAQQQVPRRIDGGVVRWSAPGPRRVFALVGTTPMFPPFGEGVSHIATFYEAGEAAERFFHGLRAHVYRDLSTGTGEWSIAEVVYRIEP